MTEAKHTPGPWSQHEKGIHPHAYVCGPEEEYEHGRDKPVVAYITGGNSAANARLIAAAPDILQMLKVAQLWLEIDGRFDMQGINAAISKATAPTT